MKDPRAQARENAEKSNARKISAYVLERIKDDMESPLRFEVAKFEITPWRVRILVENRGAASAWAFIIRRYGLETITYDDTARDLQVFILTQPTGVQP